MKADSACQLLSQVEPLTQGIDVAGVEWFGSAVIGGYVVDPGQTLGIMRLTHLLVEAECCQERVQFSGGNWDSRQALGSPDLVVHARTFLVLGGLDGMK
jgi:hypothetical protein